MPSPPSLTKADGIELPVLAQYKKGFLSETNDSTFLICFRTNALWEITIQVTEWRQGY